MKQKEDKIQEEIKKYPEISPEDKGNIVLKVQNFVEENRKLVIGISLGVLVLAVLFFFIKNRIDESNREDSINASAAISRIMQYYQDGNYQKALNGDSAKKVQGEKVIGLIEIVNKYEGTDQGKYAALYAASALLNLNRYQEAKKYFEIALKSPAKIVQEGANAGLATVYEMEGKYKEAADYYEQAALIAVEQGLKNRYQFFQALCLEKAGDKEKAEKLYREVIGDNRSDYVNSAKAGLIRLGTIIE
jgi:tetratricopeptide (TPR) repeat protein